MVDNYMACVDRAIASACFEYGNRVAVGGAGFEGQRGAAAAGYAVPPAQEDGGGGDGRSSDKFPRNNNRKQSERKGVGEVVECRICQEEGQESDMEAPCACSGTIKFAHRKCIQRWCNKKGNIVCEICNQAYAPNYSIPPSRTISDYMTIDIRQGWGPQIDLNGQHFLAITAAEQQLLHGEYADFVAENNRGTVFCHSLAFTLLLLLLVCHILMIAGESGIVKDTSGFFNVSILQLATFFLPCYGIVQACCIIQGRWRQQH